MTSNHPTPTYTSYAQLLNAHDDLLRQLEATADESGTPEIWAQAQTLISAGSDLGKLLDTSRERRAAQSILDYWANTLRRADQDTPPARLASFDPTLAPELPDSPCPYRGLNAFTDAQFFYGREEVTATVLQKLRDGAQLVAVVGPSGSGKSSVVLGGLIEALKNGAVRDADGPSDSATWHILPILVPDQYALARLDDALTRASDDIPNLLVIDQFEELFTLTRDEAQSRAFAERLLAWLAQGNRAILTLRSDFEQRMQGLPALYEMFERGRVDLRPMNLSALRSTIEKPAAEVGLRFDEGIVDDVLGKMLGVNEGLPLLQFTLLKLWKLRQRNRVTWEAYRRLGEDPRRALGKSAEALYQGLTPAQQSIAKRLFLKLVSPKEGENEFTRNRLSRRELAAGENPERVNEVLAKLLDEGLLRITGNEAQIEVMHEALVRNWPTLDQWLRDERNSLERRFLLQRRATQWDKDGRPSTTGLSGRDLEEAARLDGLDDLTQAYVSAGVKAEDKAKKREEEFKIAQAVAKIERRRRQVVSILLAISLIASAVAGWAIWQLQKSLQQVTTAEKAARSRELAAIAQIALEDNVESSLIIAVDANQTAPTNESRLILEKALEKSVKSKSLNGHTKPTNDGQWSPVSDQVLTASDDASARIWDATTGKEIVRFNGHIGPIKRAIWSTNGKLVLTASEDGTARIWDVTTGKELIRLVGHEASVINATWSPDEMQILTVSNDNTVRIWSSVSGKEMIRLSVQPQNIWADLLKATWSPDGKRVLISSMNRAWVCDPVSGAVLMQISREIIGLNGAIWSKDGKKIATTNLNKTVEIWDSFTGKELISLRHIDSISDAQWLSNDERLLVGSETFMSGSGDSEIRLWNTNTGKELARVTVDSRRLNSMSLSKDTTKILIAASDNTAQIWDMLTSKKILTLSGHTGYIKKAIWSSNNEKVLTIANDGARIWDLKAGNEFAEKLIYPYKTQGRPDTLDAIQWSPNGQYILVADYSKAVQIWDTTSGKKAHDLDGHVGNDSITAIWSRSGNQLFTSSGNGLSRIWGAKTGQPITRLDESRTKVLQAQWSSNDFYLLTTSYTNTAQIWRTDAGSLYLRLVGHEKIVNSAYWSPDDKFIVTASADMTARIWDAATGHELIRLNGHKNSVQRAIWSADGKMIATADSGGIVKIWDSTTGKEITSRNQHRGSIESISWSLNSKLLLTIGRDQIATIWDPYSNKEVVRIQSFLYGIYGGYWSSDGTKVLIYGNDKVSIFESKTGKELARLNINRNSITAAQWSPNEKRVATLSFDGSLQFHYTNIEDLIAVAKTYVTRELTCEERVRYLSEERDCTKQP